MKQLLFTPQQEAEAKKEYAKRHRIGGSRYYSNNQYLGYIGEKTVDELYPMFLEDNKDIYKLYDRVHFLTKEPIEVKTGSGNLVWQPKYSVAIDYDQWNLEKCTIVIYCYYELSDYPRPCTVTGWNTRKNFEEHPSKRIYKNGQWALTQWGKPMYKVQNKNGCYVWSNEVLRLMEELVNRKNE